MVVSSNIFLFLDSTRVALGDSWFKMTLQVVLDPLPLRLNFFLIGCALQTEGWRGSYATA